MGFYDYLPLKKESRANPERLKEEPGAEQESGTKSEFVQEDTMKISHAVDEKKGSVDTLTKPIRDREDLFLLIRRGGGG